MICCLCVTWAGVGGLLTQLGDAAHPRGEQRLLQRAQLSLGVALALAPPPRALLVPVQVQAVGEAQDACRQGGEQEVKKQDGRQRGGQDRPLTLLS